MTSIVLFLGCVNVIYSSSSRRNIKKGKKDNITVSTCTHVLILSWMRILDTTWKLRAMAFWFGKLPEKKHSEFLVWLHLSFKFGCDPSITILFFFIRVIRTHKKRKTWRQFKECNCQHLFVSYIKVYANTILCKPLCSAKVVWPSLTRSGKKN